VDNTVINKTTDMCVEKHSHITWGTVFEQSQASELCEQFVFTASTVLRCHGFPQMKSITARLKKGQ
jgi:hypothetical protein